MNILVTAGNTWVPIDKVRVLTNVFTGRTGASIADEAMRRNHTVTLLTSAPERAEQGDDDEFAGYGWRCFKYRTFDELRTLMEHHIMSGSFDAVVHSAAVSDYLSAGMFTMSDDKPASPLPATQKIKSDEPELWLRLVRAPKIVDQIRADWCFKGVLVKFKLEAGVDEKTLLDVSERSRAQSSADLMVANTLEGAASWAFIGPFTGKYERIARPELAPRIIEAVEKLHKERPHA